MRRTLIPLIVLCAATAMFAPGCGDSGSDTVDGPTTTYPPADTPDQLMENFKACYDAMDASAYDDEILHPDFVFVFSADTPEQIAGPTHSLTREQELDTSTNMFHGQPGVDPITGALKDPVQDIQFTSLIKVQDWEDVPVDDPDFPGCMKARYQIDISFVLHGGLNQYRIQNEQMFYVKGEPGKKDGAAVTRYRLAGQQEFDPVWWPKADETMKLGQVKSIYLSRP